ncbi:methionyl-tRNA formyltransferase [Flexivirga alba]|uniref:Methionyl-tRNA formyltransferase n=1 Tax=Flexivirga alba TaxID=702742 RepID=A0ABW2AKL1_9MICO
MRVVFAGTPEAALPSLRAIAASRHELVGVVTRPDARAGRGRSLRTSPVGLLGEQLGVPVLKPRSAKEPGFAEDLAALEPDVCPVVAYGSLVPRPVLDIPRHGWVNLHFSLLPAWRGAAPVQHAILHGDEVTGATAFLLEEGMDTGPVLGTMTETIRRTDTSGDLLGRLAEAGAGLLVAALDGLADGSITPVTQPSEGVSMAPKITVEDAEIRWQEPSFAIDRRVRACTPAPGAWTTYRDARLKIEKLDQDVPGDIRLGAGELLATKRAVYVGTGTTPVRLDTVQPHGKKAMAAADWARGVRVAEGEKLT